MSQKTLENKPAKEAKVIEVAVVPYKPLVELGRELCDTVKEGSKLCIKIVKIAQDKELDQKVVYSSLLEGGLELIDKSYASKIAKVATTQAAAALMLDHKVGINLCYQVATEAISPEEALMKSKGLKTLEEACETLGLNYDPEKYKEQPATEGGTETAAPEVHKIKDSDAIEMIKSGVDFFAQKGEEPSKIANVLNKAWKASQGGVTTGKFVFMVDKEEVKETK